MGKDKSSLDAWISINKIILKAALHNRKSMTLDINSSEIDVKDQEKYRAVA